MTVAFPLNITQTSSLLSYKEAVKQSIIQRLLTKQGSMFFDRSFGSRLYELLFEPNDLVRKSLAYTFCREALQGETRISVKQIEVNQENDVMQIKVIYTLIANDELDSLDIEI